MHICIYSNVYIFETWRARTRCSRTSSSARSSPASSLFLEPFVSSLFDSGMGLLTWVRGWRLGEKRFRGRLVFKAHRWLYHSTLGSRVIKKKKLGVGGWVLAVGFTNKGL